MSGPRVDHPDPVEVVVGWLTDDLHLLAEAFGEPVTVGGVLPPGWQRGHAPHHVRVGFDGTIRDDHPVSRVHTIRLVGWDSTAAGDGDPYNARRLAEAASSIVLCHDGTRSLNGPFESRDDTHSAYLAARTVSVALRSRSLS